MDTKLSNRPLYLQLFDVLIQRIASGEWASGSLLRNEIDLAKDYGVSVGTMRKALERLEDAKLIERKQGRGSYVANQSAAIVRNRYENILTATGNCAEWQVTSSQIDIVEPSQIAKLRLSLAEGAMVFRCIQVRSENADPIMLEEIIVPSTQFPHLDQRSYYELHAAAAEAGVLLGRGFEDISFEAPTRHVRDLLRLRKDVFVVVLERIVYSVNHTPVELRRRWIAMRDWIYRARVG